MTSVICARQVSVQSLTLLTDSSAWFQGIAIMNLAIQHRKPRMLQFTNSRHLLWEYTIIMCVLNTGVQALNIIVTIVNT
jgi:hypothetical protein